MFKLKTTFKLKKNIMEIKIGFYLYVTSNNYKVCL